MRICFLASGLNAEISSNADLDSLLAKTNLPHEIEVLNCLQKWFNETPVCFVTSGTTGTAKTFCFEHWQVKASAKASTKAFGLSKQSKFLLCMQTQFVGAAMLVYRAAFLDAELHILPSSKNPLQDLPLNHNYQFVSLVPYQLSHILACAESIEKLKAFDTILIGGAALSTAHVQAIQSLQLNAFHSYGMTETLSHIALQIIAVETTFTCLPGVKIHLNEAQCLTIETPWNTEPIVTNDLAKINQDGSFEIHGRVDFQINSGGIKFNPELIEKDIASILFAAGIEEPPFIIGWRKHEALGQEIVLITEGKKLAEPVFLMLGDALKNKFHPYAYPKDQIAVHAFARNENGKIKRLETIETAHNQT
jgi:O-succinylbenzoic acid--CoA ligase